MHVLADQRFAPSRIQQAHGGRIGVVHLAISQHDHTDWRHLHERTVPTLAGRQSKRGCHLLRDIGVHATQALGTPLVVVLHHFRGGAYPTESAVEPLEPIFHLLGFARP